MIITQITDLHIGFEGQNTHGVDVRHNFLMILGEVKKYEPDYLVLTGDLCYSKGDAEVYRWILEKLERLDIPYFVIPGNHDDRSMMRDVFNLDYIDQKELYYARKFGKQTVLFLDSADGLMTTKQYNWIERQLKQAEGTILIFCHHPPCKAGAYYMDNNHSFREIDILQKVLLDYDDNIHLFCGHYHMEATIHLENLHVHISPSLITQIDKYEQVFKIDHFEIGHRQIILNGDQLNSYVRYLEGAKMEGLSS